MKRRRFYIDGLLRHGAVILMAAVVLALGRGIWLDHTTESLKQFLCGAEQQVSVWFGWLWKEQYPISRLTLREDGKAQDTQEKDIWWINFLWSGIPWYRCALESNTDGITAWEDPAYQKFLANREFVSEHEYLFHYGGEDTNAEAVLTAEIPLEAAQESLPQAEAVLTTPVHTVRADMTVRGTQYVKEQLKDYDFLMKHFYNVHPSTTADRNLMDVDQLLSKNFTLKEDLGKPQILIYHTHSQETYADFGPEHPDGTVVGIGTYLTELLQEKGYRVLHDTSVYDLHGENLDRNKAYTYALDGITQILQQNPSIEVILDLHRDGVKAGYHMVSEVNGKPTAPIMFFNGMSQTPEGAIEYLQNAYREDNLAFSLQMQLNAAAYYPGFTRKIYLKGLRYNLHLRACSALIEVGAQTNTYQEARNAMEPLAELLDMVLQGN